MESGDHGQVGADGGEYRHDRDDDNEGDGLENPRAAGSCQGRRYQDEERGDMKNPAEVPMQGQVLESTKSSSSMKNT